MVDRGRTHVSPRLLSRRDAAAYCGVSTGLFEQAVAVPPLRCFGSKKLWDRHALDRWLDHISECDKAPKPLISVAERLNGNQGAGR